jgi:hypothetical protein
MRVAFLVGAGCPMSIRIPNKDAEKTGDAPLIPGIRTLTQMVRDKIDSEADIGDAEHSCSATLTKVLELFHAPQETTIEHILSHVRLLLDVIQKDALGNISKADLQKLDRRICGIITEFVNIQIPIDQKSTSPYHRFASWIAAIRREHPVEIFTTNYDLLLEQALEEQRIPYFDGFVGSRHAFFDLASIEHDALPSRWARLWKLHGSINWLKTDDGHIERCPPRVDVREQQMIYPSHLKYDQSRKFPYLAMQDRLKTFLAPGRSRDPRERGPAVLVTCGYSFADQHLNELILQSLRGNPAAVCYALLYGSKDQSAYKEARDGAKQQPNLQLFAEDGAIISTVEAHWNTETQDSHPLKEFVVADPTPLQGPSLNGWPITPESHRLTLGDFASLGRFLLRQNDRDSTVHAVSNNATTSAHATNNP